MTRRKSQLTLGEIDHVWPVCACPGGLGLYATIVDIVRSRKPMIGTIYISTMNVPGSFPVHADFATHGRGYKIGDYTSAAERLALLSGEKIRHGKQKQQDHKEAERDIAAAREIDEVRDRT